MWKIAADRRSVVGCGRTLPIVVDCGRLAFPRTSLPIGHPPCFARRSNPLRPRSYSPPPAAAAATGLFPSVPWSRIAWPAQDAPCAGIRPALCWRLHLRKELRGIPLRKLESGRVNGQNSGMMLSLGLGCGCSEARAYPRAEAFMFRPTSMPIIRGSARELWLGSSGSVDQGTAT